MAFPCSHVWCSFACSGGNMSHATRADVWSRDELSRLPSLDLKFAPTN